MQNLATVSHTCARAYMAVPKIMGRWDTAALEWGMVQAHHFPTCINHTELVRSRSNHVGI